MILVRRKSAVERLAETKYNYIKSSPTPQADRDGKDNHKIVHKSMSTSALKSSLVILTESPAILLTKSCGDCHQNQLSDSNIKSEQTIQSSEHLYNNSSSVHSLTRKRNLSVSSRLSNEVSNNLEQQLRQLILENCEEQISDNQRVLAKNQMKNETKTSSVIKSGNENTVKSKVRLKTANQNIVREKAVPKQRSIFTNNFDKTSNKTIVDNKKTSNNCCLKSNSSLNKTPINSKLIIQSKPLTQPLLQKSIPANISSIRSTSTTSHSLRQMSISRSKSDVSKKLLLRRNKSKDEIERFFETLGLDSGVWDSIRSEATNSLISTNIESWDSFDSSDMRHGVMSSSSSSSFSTDRHSTRGQSTVERHQTLNCRVMQSRSCNSLSSGTSIVEKNARVIKWLYNCRKAMVQN